MKDISKERIDTSVKRIAQIINTNEAVIQDLQWACDAEKWNDDAVCQLKEAQMLLGEALATLVNWFDDAEGEEERQLQEIAKQAQQMSEERH